MIEISNIDYTEWVSVIGTAHFTRRSLRDVRMAIRVLKPLDIAIELDWLRLRWLNSGCITCPKRGSCMGICEFVGAVDALGNANANIWLVDMTEREMRQRIRMRRYQDGNSRLEFRQRNRHNDGQTIALWEKGLKEEAVENSKRMMDDSRRDDPSLWSVLIEERDALMSARLAWIASENIDHGIQSQILAFVGAAHVEGIRSLLSNPALIRENLRRFGLPFSKPTLVRRVEVTV
jgi:pheromone shutdown protein TraB